MSTAITDVQNLISPDFGMADGAQRKSVERIKDFFRARALGRVLEGDPFAFFTQAAIGRYDQGIHYKRYGLLVQTDPADYNTFNLYDIIATCYSGSPVYSVNRIGTDLNGKDAFDKANDLAREICCTRCGEQLQRCVPSPK